MYDVLIKSLREQVAKQKMFGLENAESTILMEKAAKAIEELRDKFIAENTERRSRIPINETDKRCWIPVAERVPEQFVSVQAHMTDAGPFPAVREAYLVHGDQWFFPALSEIHPVDMWMPFSETPKENET